MTCTETRQRSMMKRRCSASATSMGTLPPSSRPMAVTFRGLSEQYDSQWLGANMLSTQNCISPSSQPPSVKMPRKRRAPLEGAATTALHTAGQSGLPSPVARRRHPKAWATPCQASGRRAAARAAVQQAAHLAVSRGCRNPITCASSSGGRAPRSKAGPSLPDTVGDAEVKDPPMLPPMDQLTTPLLAPPPLPPLSPPPPPLLVCTFQLEAWSHGSTQPANRAEKLSSSTQLN
mmetsp:Transcript_4901/g.14118  ORF Transcript_4901/g.14118 Transcript_4901/m.14118 type:complete len:233 (+) Transcript_4901:911-1609(+)